MVKQRGGKRRGGRRRGGRITRLMKKSIPNKNSTRRMLLHMVAKALTKRAKRSGKGR